MVKATEIHQNSFMYLYTKYCKSYPGTVQGTAAYWVTDLSISDQW